MNNAKPSPRPYRQSARAIAAERTLEAILNSGLHHFGTRRYDNVTLDEIAADSGVTVQTILRRVGSKEKLFEACAERMGNEIMKQRTAAPVGDVGRVVDNLITHYEKWGDTMFRLLMQEDNTPILKGLLVGGRQMHREWVIEHLPDLIDTRKGNDRKRRIAQLVAVTDIYTWRILRRQTGLSRKQTCLAMLELIQALQE